VIVAVAWLDGPGWLVLLVAGLLASVAAQVWREARAGR
jgi:hypothetical protein